MALKGLDIFKLTPKTNCKECGNPTCMAFAMKIYHEVKGRPRYIASRVIRQKEEEK